MSSRSAWRPPFSSPHMNGLIWHDSRAGGQYGPQAPAGSRSDRACAATGWGVFGGARQEDGHG